MTTYLAVAVAAFLLGLVVRGRPRTSWQRAFCRLARQTLKKEGLGAAGPLAELARALGPSQVIGMWPPPSPEVSNAVVKAPASRRRTK
jgi:hypothetical protein